MDVIHLPAFILELDSGKPVVIPDGLKIWLSFEPTVEGSSQSQRHTQGCVSALEHRGLGPAINRPPKPATPQRLAKSAR
jgi:hypothetical protein